MNGFIVTTALPRLLYASLAILPALNVFSAEKSKRDVFIFQAKIIKAPVGHVSFTTPDATFALTTVGSETSPDISGRRIEALARQLLKKDGRVLDNPQLSKVLARILKPSSNARMNLRIRQNDVSTDKTSHGESKTAIFQSSHDGGPPPEAFRELSDYLKKHHVSVSFDRIGENVVMRWKSADDGRTDGFTVNPVDGSFCVPLKSGNFNLGGVSLSEKDGRLLWNGSSQPSRNSGVSVADCSDLRIPAGGSAACVMISPTDYLIRRPSGLYEKKTHPLEKSPGLILKVSVAKTRSEDAVRLNLDITLNILKGRKSVVGLRLNAGEPVIMTDNHSQTFVQRIGEWVLTCGYAIKEKVAGRENQIYVVQRILRARSGK